MLGCGVYTLGCGGYIDSLFSAIIILTLGLALGLAISNEYDLNKIIGIQVKRM